MLNWERGYQSDIIEFFDNHFLSNEMYSVQTKTLDQLIHLPKVTEALKLIYSLFSHKFNNLYRDLICSNYFTCNQMFYR